MKTPLVIAALLCSTPALARDALVLSTVDAYGDDVVTTLQLGGQFDNVAVWRANLTTPTLVDLMAHDVVMLQRDAAYADSDGLGDVLADYVDAGGAVVAPSFDFAWSEPGGRFRDDGYHAMGPGTVGYVDERQASLYTQWGVSYVSGVFNVASPALTPGAIALAFYDDGALLMASHHPSGAGMVVAVNDYNVSDAVGRSDFWDVTSDGIGLWSGAARYAGSGRIETLVTGFCDAPASIRTIRATPGATLAYVSGQPGGSSTVPAGTCAGTPLPLGNIKLQATRVADARGDQVIELWVPLAVCGAPYLVLDLESCAFAEGTFPSH